MISYQIEASPLGRILLAATPAGLCALYFGDQDAALEAELAREFPVSQRRGATQLLTRGLAMIQAYFEGNCREFALELDLHGSPFQQQVWSALRDIPYGGSSTYQAIALQLGYLPGAARAVGRACATNPLSLIVPCHRMLRRDGELAGYRWGLQRKRALRDLEQRCAHSIS